MALLAYLDANSGSLIVSAIAAGLAGVGVAIRVGSRRARRALSGTFRRRGAEELDARHG